MSLSEPPKAPIAVRQAETITTSFISLLLSKLMESALKDFLPKSIFALLF
jgi:hypothetical protein